MGNPEFNQEQIDARFVQIIEAEQRLDDQSFLLDQQQEYGVDSPPSIEGIASILREMDPYPDNLGDRSERPRAPQKSQFPDDDFDAPWYQGRI